MKNKFLVVAMLATTIFTSCNQDKLEDAPLNKETKVSRPYNMLMYKDIVAMLEHYDKTRKPLLENGLGFEDTRMNYYSIETIENYLVYVKTLAKEKNIKITGINFISAAYPYKTKHGTPNYQTNMFMPTTEIRGENVCFDPVYSTKDKIVTMKEMLAKYGYNWVYDTKRDYDNRNVVLKEVKDNLKNRETIEDQMSSAGNLSHKKPPYPDEDSN